MALSLFSQTSASHISYGSDRSGMYSENSLANIRVVQSCEPLVLQAIQTVPAKCGHVFTIAEYGCADGGVSLPLLYACVEVLKSKHGAELQIHVAYEDQPMNDFKSLFFRLQGKPLHAIMTPHLSCFLLFLFFFLEAESTRDSKLALMQRLPSLL